MTPGTTNTHRIPTSPRILWESTALHFLYRFRVIDVRSAISREDVILLLGIHTSHYSASGARTVGTLAMLQTTSFHSRSGVWLFWVLRPFLPLVEGALGGDFTLYICITARCRVRAGTRTGHGGREADEGDEDNDSLLSRAQLDCPAGEEEFGGWRSGWRINGVKTARRRGCDLGNS